MRQQVQDLPLVQRAQFSAAISILHTSPVGCDLGRGAQPFVKLA